MVQLSSHYFQKSHFLEPSPWPTSPQPLCLRLSASSSALDKTERAPLTEQVSAFPHANPASKSPTWGCVTQLLPPPLLLSLPPPPPPRGELKVPGDKEPGLLYLGLIRGLRECTGYRGGQPACLKGAGKMQREHWALCRCKLGSPRDHHREESWLGIYYSQSKAFPPISYRQWPEG